MRDENGNPPLEPLRQAQVVPIARPMRDNRSMARWAALVLLAPVTALADPPYLVNGPNTEVGEGGSVALVPGVVDPEGDVLSYAWDLDGDGELDDSTDAKPVWSAAGHDGPESVLVVFRASDAWSSVTGAVAVDVLNVPPRFEPLEDVRIAARRRWRLSFVVSDLGNDSVELELLDPAPSAVELDSVAGELSWTPRSSDVGEHRLLLRAEDDDHAVTLHAVTLTVFENTPPPPPDIVFAIMGQDGTGTVVLDRVDDADGDTVEVGIDIDSNPCFCSAEHQSSGWILQGETSTSWSTPWAFDLGSGHDAFFLRRRADDGLDESEELLSLIEAPPMPPEVDELSEDCEYSEPGCCGGHSSSCSVAGKNPGMRWTGLAIGGAILWRLRRRRGFPRQAGSKRLRYTPPG